MTAQVMSLDDCVLLAIQSNKQIQAAQHMVSQYEHTQKSVYANFFPNVSLTAADIYSTLNGSSMMDIATPVGAFAAQHVQDLLPTLINDAMRDHLAQDVKLAVSPLNPDVGFKMKNLLTAGVTLEQPIYMGGKITTANRMGEIGVKIALQAEKLTREQIIVDVFEAYQLLVKAKEMSIVAYQYDSLLNQIDRDVKSAVKHGMASHNDELKVAVKKTDAELKIRQAENGIRLARMNLCQLIGKPLDTKIEPLQDQEPDFVGLVDKDARVSDRTEYQLLDLKSHLSWEKVRLEKSAYMPQLGFMLNVGMLDGLELLDNKLFRHKLNLTVGAVLKVPIFHGNETKHKVAAAREELRQDWLRQEELADKMNLDLQQQANNVDEARLELQLRKRNLDQCEENLRTSRKAYSVGMETLSEVLTAQLLWQQAYAELVESRYQAKVKIMKWRKAAGRI
jgi:outer membrane protein TolC